MRFISLFSGALVATAAVNILLSSDAHAGYPPNGWSQVGQSCGNVPSPNNSSTYYKLQKNNDSSKWGVYRNKNTWQGNTKGVSLEVANAKMNDKCGCLDSYASNGGCPYSPY